MKTKYIYAHICPNGKGYIGCTNNVKQRWNSKLYNRHFQEAIQEYGWDNIKHIVLAEVNEADALWLERKMMLKYDTFYPNGYNILSSGFDDEEKKERKKDYKFTSKKLNKRNRFILKLLSLKEGKRTTADEKINEILDNYFKENYPELYKDADRWM